MDHTVFILSETDVLPLSYITNIPFCKRQRCRSPNWTLGEVLISLSQAIEPVGGYTTESVTLGQCDDRPTVTFPASEHHRPLTGTKLYCLVTEEHVCVCELNNLYRVVT